MKIHTQTEMLDKHIGVLGTPNRDAFERELKIDLVGDYILSIRRKTNWTLAHLSEVMDIEKSAVLRMKEKATDISDECLDKAYSILKLIYDEQEETASLREGVSI